MCERRGMAAEAYPNPAQAMQQSRSSHLLSIKMVLFHAAAVCVHMELTDAPFSHDCRR
jgi:hypothetical protein